MTAPFMSSQPRPPEHGSENIGDPWGARRAEQLLTSLEGVLSARIVTTPLGEVSEVHVLAQSVLTPKQLVRNIESALLAHLGLKVDHRKISIAQTAEVKPIEALQTEAVRERVLKRTLLFEDVLVVAASRPHRVAVRVTLSHHGIKEGGEVECPDTQKGRQDGAAEATLEALSRLFQMPSLVLEGTAQVGVFGRRYVMAAVQDLGGREKRVFTGTAEIRDSVEQAAVLAVLDATNRWTNFQRPS